MKRIAVFLLHLLLLLILIDDQFTHVHAAAPETIEGLKRSVNQLMRQQHIQTHRYKTQLEASARSELREAAFALSEVQFQMTMAWEGIRSQYNAAESTCASQAPYSPDTMATEATLDLNQCLADVEQNFNEVLRPIDVALSEEIGESSQLNFWLQSALFERHAATLENFDAEAATQEIFRKAVLWDNVGSIGFYKSVRSVPAPFNSAGEWAFICGLQSYNNLFRKLKATENHLNTVCAINVKRGSPVTNYALPEAVAKLMTRFS